MGLRVSAEAIAAVHGSYKQMARGLSTFPTDISRKCQTVEGLATEEFLRYLAREPMRSVGRRDLPPKLPSPVKPHIRNLLLPGRTLARGRFLLSHDTGPQRPRVSGQAA